MAPSDPITGYASRTTTRPGELSRRERIELLRLCLDHQIHYHSVSKAQFWKNISQDFATKFRHHASLQRVQTRLISDREKEITQGRSGRGHAEENDPEYTLLIDEWRAVVERKAILQRRTTRELEEGDRRRDQAEDAVRAGMKRPYVEQAPEVTTTTSTSASTNESNNSIITSTPRSSTPTVCHRSKKVKVNAMQALGDSLNGMIQELVDYVKMPREPQQISRSFTVQPDETIKEEIRQLRKEFMEETISTRQTLKTILDLLQEMRQ